jgi:nucleoid-associated protein YgaU
MSPPAVPAAEDKSVKPEKASGSLPVTPVVPISAPQEVAPTVPKVVATTPSLAVPAVGARPTVESFTEQEYVVKPADTFEKISKQFYDTPDYAEALRLYNRNDSLLSDLGRDGSSVLKPGLHLSIPQWEILKKRYGDTIPAVRPAGTTAPAPGSETSNKVPLAPKEAAPPASKPVTYRVPAGAGQGMYEMAKELLGNGDRWMEIRNLNQQYDPSLKIPAGKEVRLPADARVAEAARQP